jgi:hypothetical protein
LQKRSGDQMIEMTDIQREVDENYDEFRKLLPSIIGQHRDKYALMKNRKILGYFSTAQDAREAATSFVPDGIYSIQQVTDTPINLGFFTYAIPLDTV